MGVGFLDLYLQGMRSKTISYYYYYFFGFILTCDNYFV
jgi:hypothetical protein